MNPEPRPPGPATPGGTTTNEPQEQPPRNSVSSLLFITFVLFLLNGNGDDFSTQMQLRDSLHSLEHQQSNYSAWLNGTQSNFTLNSYPAARLPLLYSFLDLPGPIDYAYNSYYRNLSGVIKGPADYFNLTSPLPGSSWEPFAQSFLQETNRTEAFNRVGRWNWSATEEAVIILAESKVAGDFGEQLNIVHGTIDLGGKSLPSSLSFRFEGVHFPLNGSLFGLAVPAGRQLDARQIPSLVPIEVQNTTAHAINAELASRLVQFKHMLDSGTLHSETTPNKHTTCTFQLYLQMRPCSVSQAEMQELEQELDEPTGVSTVKPPPVNIDAVLASQECGILLHLSENNGLKYQRLWRKATTFAGYASTAYLILLILTVRQTEMIRTPAGISRVSRWTFAAQAFADVYSFALYVLIASNASTRSSLSLIAPGFLAAILAFFETRYMALIHSIQGPEDAATLASDIVFTNFPSLLRPLAIAASRLRGVQLLNHIADPHSKFWISLMVILLVFIRLTFAVPMVILFIAIIYSFWIPQIVRNSKKGIRRSLQKKYVLGVTLCRVFFVLYVFACPENILPFETTRWIWLIVGWQILQILLLTGQEYLGPNFFLPKTWKTADGYDYHPPMHVIDPEAPEQSLGDCSICMESIIIQPEHPSAQLQEKAGLLMSVGVRRQYALAPCSHLFHTSCLERWLAIKNICPQCRRPLPAM